MLANNIFSVLRIRSIAMCVDGHGEARQCGAGGAGLVPWAGLLQLWRGSQQLTCPLHLHQPAHTAFVLQPLSWKYIPATSHQQPGP